MKTKLLILFASLALAVSRAGSQEPLPSVAASLTNLPVVDYKVGFGDLWISRSLDRHPVYLHGKPPRDYLFAHAPSSMVYEIPPGTRSFSAWGVRSANDDNIIGSWIYIVRLDGKEVYHSQPLADYPDCEVKIDVPIPLGAKQIELIIDDMDNNFADHSIWAEPVFNK